ncbi:MAG TPA: outer membrane beta-barrel protein [Ignavibacteriaceae bacterium]|nr:outer membrane beta-barrel protein [Ignavibacteriaceae bacterium]
MKKFFYLLVLTLVIGSVSLSAQNFAKKGVWELGGGIGFSSSTGVSNGESADDAATTFTFEPYIGYFVINSLELGLIPRFNSYSFGDYSINSFGIYFAPAWNFDLQSNLFPFIEGRIGYNTSTVEYEDEEGTVEQTLSGLAYGARGGLKYQLGNSALVNVSLGYTMVTLDPEDSEGDRNGSNDFDVMVGFTVFLGK